MLSVTIQVTALDHVPGVRYTVAGLEGFPEIPWTTVVNVDGMRAFIVLVNWLTEHFRQRPQLDVRPRAPDLNNAGPVLTSHFHLDTLDLNSSRRSVSFRLPLTS